jgi:peptidoglycan/LPS O-acetylase OafA/YrhL
MLNELTRNKVIVEGKNTTKAATPSTNERITELDGLRGVAILLVLSFHYINNQLWNAQSSIGKALCKATSFGWVGVDLFFVLSGFLIGSILIKNKGSKNFFSTFYIRRVVRIIPNYYLAITLFFIICVIPYFQDNFFLTGNNVLPWWSYYVMLHNVFMGRLGTMGNDSMSITWSIGIEEQFYLIFPFIIFFIKEKWLPPFVVFVIIAPSVLSMQLDKWVTTYLFFPSRKD